MSSKNKKSDPTPRGCGGGGGGGRKSRFPELPPKYSSSRELRNKAEKMRRDRLNKLIEEMRTLVPIICNKTNKSEKTRSNILRLTANYLKVSRLFPKEDSVDSSMTVKNMLVGDGLPHLESMEGFFIILAEDGRVLFVSENIDKFIRYSQVEMMGLPIYNFTHPADQNKMQSYLSKKEKVSSTCPSPSAPYPSSPPPNVPPSPASYNSMALANPSPSSSTSGEDRGPRQSFYIRLREKPLAKNDNAAYEHMHVVGHLRKTENVEEKDSVGQYTFIGVVRPVRDRPITELSLMESIQDQYLTRHLPDGRIIYTDHRISTIAGYTPSEVKGKSAFNFFYAEDLPWTTMAMRHMFASSNGEGSTVYRLFTQTGELICLQTKGFLEFNKTTNKIESFLCINTVIRPEDTEHYLNEQKERFTPFITELQINAIKSSKDPFGLAALTSADQFQSSSQVSVISKLSQHEAPSSAASIVSQNFENTPNSLKRFPPVTSTDNWDENLSDEPPRKKNSPPKQTSNINLSQKRKTEEKDLQCTKVPKNWQYTTAREEPMHRSLEGIRVMDIDQQLFPDGYSSIPRDDQLENKKIDFQELINQLNKSHQSKVLQESLETNSVKSSLNFPSNEQTKAETHFPPTGTTKVERTGSVIKMLPKYNMLTHIAHIPEREYITREVDIIKEELLHSSTSEADRIAEKLKVMLAPLSGHQSRLVDATAQVRECHGDNIAKTKDSVDLYQDSDLLDILDQDLLFSTENQDQNKKHQSSLNEELPSKSS